MKNRARFENQSFSKIGFCALFISLFLSFTLSVERADGKSRKQTRSKKHSRWQKVQKVHKPTKEEELAAREAAEHEAAEAQAMESKNTILARAYKLYDSGTSENLLGNHKFSVLQLKLADELLKEHGQNNTSLGIANLTALATCAEAAHDYSLARSSYDRLLSLRPQDSEIILGLAKLEASQSNFTVAQNYINRLLEANPNNPEGRVLFDFVNSKLKPAKK